MKFDYVIGNPPYQDSENHMRLYPDFYVSCLRVGKNVELIFPVGWQEPKNANNLRKMNVPEIKEDRQIVFIDNVHNVFQGITGAEWTNIILWKQGFDNGLGGKQKIYTEGKNPVITQLYTDKVLQLPPILESIKSKVMQSNFVSLTSIMYLQNKYNLDVLLREHPECRNEISCGTDKRMRSNAFDKVSVFFDDKQDDSIKVVGLVKGKRAFRYIPTKYFMANEATDKYKVLMPVASNAGVFGSILSPFEIAYPNVGYTETFMAIGAFDTELEASNVFKYLKTKFVRTMLGILKTNQNGKREVWACVPLQDYTSFSDIDWSQSISDIDRQLYAKYGLTQEEIDFIETHVKAMD